MYGERTTGDPSFFFHTGLDRNPWFVLDLGAVERVSEIRIYNRWGQPSERAQLMRVWLGETEDEYRLVFDAVDAHCHPGLPLHLRFDNARFRYLKVDLDEEQHLHLDGDRDLRGALRRHGRSNRMSAPAPTSRCSRSGRSCSSAIR